MHVDILGHIELDIGRTYRYRYTPRSIITSTQFSVVYEGERKRRLLSKKTDRCAMKIPAVVEWGNLLVNESIQLSHLHHDHIVSHYGLFFQDNIPCMVTEYLPETIAGYFTKISNPTVFSNRIVAMIHQVSAGLSHLEAEAIVHRDIKPANIMCDGLDLKIIDFGLAVPEGYDTGKMAEGSPYYMSPETVARGGVTPVSDVYSLGVMALTIMHNYHRNMWQGDHLFQADLDYVGGTKVQDTLHQALNGEIGNHLLYSIRECTPMPLYSMLEKMVEPDSTQRITAFEAHTMSLPSQHKA